MRLKEIKLAGFKSFVDPTTVIFPGNRCAVVGPNGCGKSNIIDAVRWVLGESSARHLRGEALTDVIFNGSNTRQPTSLASVELVFDNRDGRVGGEFAKGKFAAYSEIAIRREVNRESQSTYYLNGTRCRRRDVADVFLGSGFGPRSYSIIEQGMVSQLVEAKPEDLRAYLEEAAGISKYRERRRETQNRIKHTLENLERITDVADELDRQLASLKRQARAAERYRDLKQEQRRRSAELQALRLAAIGAELTQKEARIDTLEVEHEKALAERQAIDTALEQNRAAHVALSDELGEVQGRSYAIGGDVVRLEQAIGYNTDRLAQFKRDLRDVEARQRDIKGQLDADTARIEALNAELTAKASRLADAEADDRDAAIRLERIEERVRVGQRAWEDYTQRAGENERETRIQQNRIEDGEQVLRNLRARAGGLEAEPGSVVDRGVERLARQIDESARLVDALVTDIATNGLWLADAREEAELAERARDEARSELQLLGRELSALAAVLEAALGGTNDAAGHAQRWLGEHGLDHAPRLGERLGVASGWELAVEAVLGNVVDAVAVQDTAALASDLAGVEGGRVTLFEAGPFSTPAHALPPLSDFVDAAVGSLLAGVFAADSMADAIAHRSSLAPGQSIVTRDGVWLGVDWVRVDKGVDPDQGVVQRGREMERLEAACEEAERRFAERTERLVEIRERLATLEQERETLQARHASHAAELSRVTREHDVRQVRMEEADARARRNAAEREEAGAQIEDELKRIQRCRARLAELLEEAERLRAEGAELRATRAFESGELHEVRKLSQEARDAFHVLRVDCQGIKASQGATETARQRLLDQGRDFDKRTGELSAAIAKIEAEIPGQRTALDAKLAERRNLETELADLRRKIESVEAELGHLDRETDRRRGNR